MDRPSSRRRSWLRRNTLPLMRFTSVVVFLVALDPLICVGLWLGGGNSSYLRHSVDRFSFTHSTFDLAVLAVVRGLVLVFCLYFTERYSHQAVTSRKRTKRRSALQRARLSRLGVFAIATISIIYVAIKGVFIIRDIVGGRWEKVNADIQMHVTYRILCVLALVFPILEIGVGVASWFFVNRSVRLQRLQLLINAEDGEEEEDDDEDEEGGKKKKKVDLKRLFLLAKPEYPLMTVGVLSLVISSGAVSLAPYLFGRVIDYALPSHTNCSEQGIEPSENVTCTRLSMDAMNNQVVILLAVFVIAAISTLARAILFNLSGERFVARLRKNLFASILRQEVGFFDKNRTGELTNRLASDTQVIQSAVTVNISMLARYTLQMILSIGLMFYISPRLTAVLLSVVPIIAISAVQYGRWLKNLRKSFQDKLAHANSTAEESISNITTVRSFSNEAKMTSIYDVDIEKSYHLGRKLAFLSGTFMGVMTFLVFGASALVLWYGGFLVYHRQLAPGTLISLMLYTLNLAMSFAILSNLYGEFMQALGASIRIFELMDRESEVEDGKEVPDSFDRGITFEDVCFSYPARPDEPVLKGISFEVKPGQVVALVGPSGGGKSTCVRLIEHFYEITGGTVRLGEMEVKMLDPSWFRKHIGLVSQEPVLFASSIRDNIAYGKDSATQEEIVEAAKQANAHEFITSFESGYDTMVGERGIRLSGGQKQRIAIARALLLDPDILLLDEATSALDAESEHLVQEAIDRAMTGRTVLVIAHRLSTVKDASQVIVIEKGSVVEQGTHSELIGRDGVYKQLVMRQLTTGDHTTREERFISNNKVEATSF